MKSISAIKFFTAVSFLIVSLQIKTSSAFAESAGTPLTVTKTQAEVEIAFCGDKSNKTKSLGLWKKYSCDGDPSNTDCKTDMKDYQSAADKASGACDSFEKVPGKNKNTCEARINACRKKINSGVSPESTPTSTNDLTGTLMTIYMRKNYPDAGPSDNGTNGTAGAPPSCTNFTPKDARKDKKNENKELDTQIKQIKKEIADEKKKINEENVKLREKNAETDSELQKVDESLKKAILSVDKKKGEDLRKLNEDIAKSAVTIRAINAAIIKSKGEAETIKFNHLQVMQQFTEDKINTQCQAALDTAKQCFIKSSKGQGSQDPKDTCAGFTISAKGPSGTAQLKLKIQKVRDACFEQASLAVNKANFENSKSLRAIETDITEKTNQVNDANKDMTRKQNDFAAINTESDKERTNEETNAQKQIDNLKAKLDRTSKSTQEAIFVSNQTLAQLEKELNDQVTNQAAIKMGVLKPEDLNNALGDAESLIAAREIARETAIKSCCPDETSKSAVCTQLKGDSIKTPDIKGRPGSSAEGTSR